MEIKTMRACRDIRQAGWVSLSEKWGTAILVMFISAIITTALAFTIIGGLLVAGALVLGSTAFFMACTRKKETSINLLFSGFSNFGNALVASILQGIYIVLWSLLFFVPGMIKAYSYSMMYFLMNDDPSLGGNAAITKSREMMDGYKLKLFLLDLSFIGWYLLGMVTFGIALIWVIPYSNAAHAAFYEELKQIKYPSENIEQIVIEPEKVESAPEQDNAKE